MSNYFAYENLEEEEERSRESDSRSGDISGLFASETSTEQPLPVDNVREYSEVPSNSLESVTILINSETHAVKEDNGGRGKLERTEGDPNQGTGTEDDNTGRSSLSNSMPVVPGRASASQVSGGFSRDMTRGDLSSGLDSGTHTEEQALFSRGVTKDQPTEGQLKARGWTGQPLVHQAALKTQLLPNMQSQVPEGRGAEEFGGEESRLFQPQRQPQMPAEKMGEAEKLIFDQEEDLEYQEIRDQFKMRALTKEETLQQELEELLHEEEAVTGSLGDSLEKAQSISDRKTEILECLDQEMGQTRKALFRTRDEGGVTAVLAKVGSRDGDRLKLSAGDLTLRAVEAWKEACDVLQQAVYPTKLNIQEMQDRFDRISGMLANGRVRCVGEHVTPEQWSLLCDRHLTLAGMIEGRRTIPVEAQALFPESKAQEIWEWYSRVDAILCHFSRLQRVVDNSSDTVSQLLDFYPGPQFKAKSEASEGPSSEDQEGSVHTRGSFDRVNQLVRSGRPSGFGYQEPQPTARPTGVGHQESHPLSESAVRRMAATAGLNFRLGGGGPAQSGSGGGGGPGGSGGHGGGGGGGPGGGGGGYPGGEQYAGGSDSSGGSRGPKGWMSAGQGGAQNLPNHLIKPKVNGQGPLAGESFGVSADEVLEQSSIMSESGYGGETDEGIRDSLRHYIVARLKQLGKQSAATEAIAMSGLPPFRFERLTGSHRASIVKSFSTVAKGIKPSHDAIFISLAEWWKMIGTKSNDMGWTTAMRVRFLANTGGLPTTKAYEVRADRVKAMMTQIQTWLPRYDENKSEERFEYWLYIWADISLKFITEFYQVQPMERVETNLVEYMGQPEHLIDSSDNDFLNSQFHKVHGMYVAMNVWLRHRSSELVNTPLLTWRIWSEWLERQEPGGPIMMVTVKAALRKLATNAESVMPKYHGLREEQLDELRDFGGVNPSEKVYELVLQKLKERALEGDLVMEAKTLSQFNAMFNQAGKASGNGATVRQKKSSNSVVTDMSTLTMNTMADQKGGSSGSGGQRHAPCSFCGLFHKMSSNGKCHLITPGGRHNVDTLVRHRSTTQIGTNGKKSLSEYWKKKFIQFLFPKLQYTKSQEDKAIKELEEAISKFPIANRAEIERFAQDQQRFANLAEVEDRSHITQLIKERNIIVNYVMGLGSKSKQEKIAKKAQKRREARREREEAESNSSDSDEDGSEGWSDEN